MPSYANWILDLCLFKCCKTSNLNKSTWTHKRNIAFHSVFVCCMLCPAGTWKLTSMLCEWSHRWVIKVSSELASPVHWEHVGTVYKRLENKPAWPFLSFTRPSNCQVQDQASGLYCLLIACCASKFCKEHGLLYSNPLVLQLSQPSFFSQLTRIR